MRSFLMAMATLLILALPLSSPSAAAQGAGDGWVVVIDSTVDTNPLGAPNVGLHTVDGRLDIETLELKDFGDAIGVRLRTAAGSGPLAEIESTVELRGTGLWDAPDLRIFALNAQFTVTYGGVGNDEPGRPMPEGTYGWRAVDAATAWDYELRIWRGAGHMDGYYKQGDSLSYFTAETRGYAPDGGKTPGTSASQNDWGERFVFGSSGGFELDDFPQQTPTPWYRYNVRNEHEGASISTSPDGALFGVYQQVSQEPYYGRDTPLGIYLDEVVDGRLVETFVGAADPPAGNGHAGNRVHVALAYDDGPHVLYHPHPARGLEAAAEGLVHAWRDAAGWHDERPLAGLDLGPIMVDHRSHLPIVAHEGRVVTAVRYADGSGLAVVEKTGTAWRLAREIPEADHAVVAIGADGRLWLAAFFLDEDGRDGRLDLTEGREGWPVAASIAGVTAYGGIANADLRASFDLAMRPDGEPCLLFATTGKTVDHLRCGGVRPVLEEELPLEGLDLYQGRLAIGPDASVHVDAGSMYGHRGPSGVWWWERSLATGWPGIAVLPDGRAVLMPGDGGYGGLDIAVQHPASQADPSRAFFIGTAAQMPMALGGYRGERPAAGAAVPAVGDPIGPPAADAPPTAVSTRDVGQQAPVGGTGTIAALAGSALILRRRR